MVRVKPMPKVRPQPGRKPAKPRGLFLEVLGYLWRRKVWWLAPMLIMLALVAVLVLIAQSTAVTPFIYTLF